MNYATSMTTPETFSLGGCCRFADLTTPSSNAVSWHCAVCRGHGVDEALTLTAHQLAAEVQHRHGKGRCDK